ncbi:MAG: hypothetical protein SPI91_04005 [Bacilli bacterium]|nr:hypothetical protein [Bacilli bacterium]
MGFFSRLFLSKEALEEELKGLAKAQEAMDERFNKKQILPEVYKQKSLEFMEKRERIQKKLSKFDKE